MKILLVEDHVHMALAIGEVLKKNKFVVDIANDGGIGLEYALSNKYDVIILDIMMPVHDGYYILSRIRESKIMTPVIMLTAKSEVTDKIKGLDLGADDYLAKPFDTLELLARIRALLRRNESIVSNEFIFNDVLLNIDELKLSYSSKCYDLTLKETLLLAMFFKNPNKVIAKEIIINKLWSYDKVVIDNNVEVYISFVRKKLNSLNTSVKIVTIRGVGYKLVGE